MDVAKGPATDYYTGHILQQQYRGREMGTQSQPDPNNNTVFLSDS